LIAIDLTTDQLITFCDFIREFSGLNFNDTNWLGLKISLKERMADQAIDCPEEYLTRLKTDSLEQDELVSLITVSETYFFRDKGQFEALRDKILPELVAKKSKQQPGRPSIKIVSCGCSIGAEPYSIAIVVLQSGLTSRADFEIIAFDINKKIIEQAKQATYGLYTFREKDTQNHNS